MDSHPGGALAGVAVPTVRTVCDLSECRTDVMTVEAVGHQWWFEYRCGLSHSLMRTRIQAVTPAEFDEWVAAQQAPAVTPEKGSRAIQGLEVFRARGCANATPSTTDRKVSSPTWSPTRLSAVPTSLTWFPGMSSPGPPSPSRERPTGRP